MLPSFRRHTAIKISLLFIVHMYKQRILLAEDHAVLRTGMRTLLNLEPDLEVVGEADDGLQAVAQAKELQPDLVLIDLSMPLMNGTEAIRHLKRRDPHVKIIVMTVHKSDEHVRAALDAGADGYILKDDSHPDLLTAIRRVASGGTYLSPRICGMVVGGYLATEATTAAAPTEGMLTSREREVVKLVAEGYKNREIADLLFISVKTVEKHRANAMHKLNLSSVVGLIAYAIDNGLVSR
jgi:DNA-binding NarL/FixJ family response regulator